MDYFEPIEREILSFKDFFRNECPDSADEIVSTEKMSKDQIRYLIHFKKEMRKRKIDPCRILEGARKHRIWGMYYMFGRELSHRHHGMVDDIVSHCDEIPEECRIPFLLSVCMVNHFEHPKLNARLLEKLKTLENRNLSKETVQHEYITVYAPAAYDRSPKSMKHHLAWFVNLDDALQEQMWCYDKAKEHKMTASDIPVNIIEANIFVKDILLESNYCTNPKEGQNVVIQDGCVMDIGIVADLDELQEDVIWEQMPGRILPDEDKEMYISRRTDEMRDAEKQAGIPFTKVSFANINLRLTKVEDVRVILQSRLRMSDGEAIRVTRELIRQNPDNGWMMTFMNNSVRDGYYKAIFLDRYDRSFFVAFASRRKKLKGYEGPYGVDRDGPSYRDRYEIVAIDPDTWASALQSVKDGGTQKTAMKKKESATEQKQRKEPSLKLNAEDIENLKKQIYIQQIDEMYEKELERKNSELESLNERMQQMHVEMQNMEKMLASARKKLADQDGISILKAGSEVEKFDHEAKAFVLKAIRHEVEHCETGTRRKDILMDVLKANSDGTENLLAYKSEEIKRIVKGYRLATEITDKLQACGFEMIKDGGHVKMRYPGDSRYIQPFASTPSDHRAGENLATQIRKKFF